MAIAPKFSQQRKEENDSTARNAFLSWLIQIGATEISPTRFPDPAAAAYDIGFTFNGEKHRLEVERKVEWKQYPSDRTSFSLTRFNGELLQVDGIDFPYRKQIKLREWDDLTEAERKWYVEPPLRPTLFGMVNHWGNRILTIRPQSLLAQRPIVKWCRGGMGDQQFIRVPCGEPNFWLLTDDKWVKDTVNGRYSCETSRGQG
jgi:hypothetical protein